jgi:hypothetical protein
MAASRTLSGRPSALRHGLLGVGLAGSALLVAATFATVIRIRVGTSSRLAGIDTALSGWDRHGPALALLALLAAVMLAGARRGAAPALAAVAVAGLAALAVAVLGDAPDVHDTGLVGAVYEDAAARPGPGFYAETIGAALTVAAGLGLLLERRR